MKICFSTLGCAERSLDEILELARKYGIDALEIRGVGGEMDNLKIVDFLSENRAGTIGKFKVSGVEPWMLGTSCVFHDEAKYASFIDEGYKAIDIAQSLGFRGIRVFGNNVVGDEAECVLRVSEGVRTLCEYAKDKGVDVLLETHGDFNTGERLGSICEHCKEYDNFGLIWDICHTRNTYGEQWRDFYEEFGKFIKHLHLKDVSQNKLVLLGDGELPIKEIVNYLLSKDYDGYFSLEWEKKWHPELPPIEEALDSMFKILGIKNIDN